MKEREEQTSIVVVSKICSLLATDILFYQCSLLVLKKNGAELKASISVTWNKRRLTYSMYLIDVKNGAKGWNWSRFLAMVRAKYKLDLAHLRADFCGVIE